MKSSNNLTGGKYSCWKITASFSLHVVCCICSLSNLPPIQLWSNIASSLCHPINPLLLLLSRHIQTWQMIIGKLYFFSLRPPGLRQQPTKQPNFYFYKLCAASTPGRGLKRQWWKADKLCNQTSQGNAHYCVWFFYACLFSFSNSFSPVYPSMANCVGSSEDCISG